MAWQVIHCDEFAAEFMEFPEGLQDELLAHQAMLAELGPSLGRPTVDTLKGGNLPNLKELRFVWQREPYRFLFAFDPKRRAIILVGGSKAGDKNFYVRMVKIAERRYENFLHEEDDDERDPQ
ncbi:MAG: type II toxin-antitoxin system RelE/ParE family toxin [Desulfovibrio sp.]|nr:type II toxin-antitoxin system RelE/ParE family toxin [Desulfovibrio sp.]